MYCLFCVVLCIVCVYMCTELLPRGGYPIAVKYIISYHIISYHIISYHIISYIISYHISYHIMSYHIISYHIIPYHIISYHIVSYRIVSYHISYHIISYHISYHIISYHISYHIISYHIILYHTISYRIVSYIISYHIIYHIISYHIMYHIIILFYSIRYVSDVPEFSYLGSHDFSFGNVPTFQRKGTLRPAETPLKLHWSSRRDALHLAHIHILDRSTTHFLPVYRKLIRWNEVTLFSHFHGFIIRLVVSLFLAGDLTTPAKVCGFVLWEEEITSSETRKVLSGQTWQGIHQTWLVARQVW